MNMSSPRIALKLVAHGDALGVREELIGDLLEEIARGRSHAWVCRQVIGLYAWAFVAYVRARARLTPRTIALAFGVVLVAATSIGSVSSVLQAWLGFYYAAGTASLFAHMATHTIGVRLSK